MLVYSVRYGESAASSGEIIGYLLKFFLSELFFDAITLDV